MLALERLVDIVDMNRWAAEASGGRALDVPCAEAYVAHARATLTGGHVGVVLSPQREIKVFARGEQVFAFRNADWHLLDLTAKYQMWEAAVGSGTLAGRLFQTALDLSDARQGALFVVLRRPLETLAELVTQDDRLDMEPVDTSHDVDTPSRRHLLHVLAGRTVTEGTRRRVGGAARSRSGDDTTASVHRGSGSSRLWSSARRCAHHRGRPADTVRR